MQTKTKASNMENRAQISGIESSRQNHFEGVTVSAGYIWSLQDTILRLERNQQDFIKQLEHANSLAAEYHETAMMYQRKYDTALHQMQELKYQHIRETAELAEKLSIAEEDTWEERALKEEYERRIVCLQQQQPTECKVQQQDDDYIEAYKSGFNDCEKCTNGEMFGNGAAADEYEEDEEEMSPVSVATPSPREEQHPVQSFNRCYSESEDEDEGEGEGEYYYNEECECFECREHYAANDANINCCSDSDDDDDDYE